MAYGARKRLQSFDRRDADAQKLNFTLKFPAKLEFSVPPFISFEKKFTDRLKFKRGE